MSNICFYEAQIFWIYNFTVTQFPGNSFPYNKILISLKENLLPKVGLSLSKKLCFICFNESPLKIMKNAFYFMLKAIFILQIFKFSS